MGSKTWLAPLTGILSIIVLIVGFVLAGEPPDPTEEPVREIVDFYVDNESSVIVGSILQGIAGALLIFFGGYLFKTLRAAGAEASAVVTLAGAITFALGMALDGTINFALAETADDIEPDAVQALSALWHNDFLPFSMGLLVLRSGRSARACHSWLRAGFTPDRGVSL